MKISERLTKAVDTNIPQGTHWYRNSYQDESDGTTKSCYCVMGWLSMPEFNLCDDVPQILDEKYPSLFNRVTEEEKKKITDTVVKIRESPPSDRYFLSRFQILVWLNDRGFSFAELRDLFIIPLDWDEEEQEVADSLR